METLLALDHSLFLLINHLPHTVLLDTAALTLSGIGAIGLIWIALSILIFVRVERKDHWFFLPVVLAAGLSELIGNLWLKDVFVRNRPPLSLGALYVIGQPADHSFPSGHATFAWALAVVLAAKEPRLKYFYYVLAFLICLSRTYIGAHYPADIVAGSLLGLAIGFLSLFTEQKVIQLRYAGSRKRFQHRSSAAGKKR